MGSSQSSETEAALEDVTNLTHELLRKTKKRKRFHQKRRPFPFLSLPPEIRNYIYSLVVTTPEVIDPNAELIFNRLQGKPRLSRRLHPETILALACVCKQTHDEVLPVYFGQNRFEFRNTYALYRFLQGLSRQRRHLIKEVVIWWHGKCPAKAFAMLAESKQLRRLTLNVSRETEKGTRGTRRSDLGNALGAKQLKGRGLKEIQLQGQEFVLPSREHGQQASEHLYRRMIPATRDTRTFPSNT